MNITNYFFNTWLYNLYIVLSFPMPNHSYGSKIICKWNDKDVEGNYKQKAISTMSNKKLFLGLALKQKKKGNRPGKAFNKVG